MSMMAGLSGRQNGKTGTKRLIGIQGLLVWAFKDECAQLDLGDGIASASGYGYASATAALIEHEQLGCRIDGGGRSDPHPDADLVAAAVSALPETFGGYRMALQIVDLVRSGQTPDWYRDVKPTCRPAEWRNSKHGPHAKTVAVGTIYYRDRGKLTAHEMKICPVRYSDTAVEVAAARRRYLDWWRAVNELRLTFQLYGGLSAFRVTDRMPTMNPWKKTT